jgi:hypothetical protein
MLNTANKGGARMPEEREEWVPMSEAAKIVGVNLSKISRLASQGKIRSQNNPYDERTRLVDLVEVKRYFHFKEK